MKKQELGFTTIELLIAISISFTIISFIYSVYFFSIRIFKSWKEKVNLEDTAMICINCLTRDIVNSADIQIPGEDKLILVLNDDRVIIYKIQNNDLFRNGVLVSSHDIKIYGLSFRFLGDTNQKNETSNLILLNIKDIPVNPLIEVELIAGSYKKRLKLKSAVHPRNIDKAVFKKL